MPGASVLIGHQRRCLQVEEALLVELRLHFNVDEVQTDDLDPEFGNLEGRLVVWTCRRTEQTVSP